MTELGPLVVSYGGGVDSTAILIEYSRRGIVPDLIVFSDTGGEKPETYQGIDLVDAWCRRVGFPSISRVSRFTWMRMRSRYVNLEGDCLHNDAIPALAFGMHSCSLKYKADPISAFLVRQLLIIRALEEGAIIRRVIGYDAGAADWKRSFRVENKGDKRWQNIYPLQEWGWDRERCQAEIARELGDEFEAAIGQRYPVKSACFFCPAAWPEEIRDLARRHPDLALRAVVMEYRSETGKHSPRKVGGLGLNKKGHPPEPGMKRNFSWRQLLLREGLLPADWKEQAVAQGLLPAGWDEYAQGLAREASRELQESRELLDAASHELERIYAEYMLSKAMKVRREARSPDWEKKPIRRGGAALQAFPV